MPKLKEKRMVFMNLEIVNSSVNCEYPNLKFVCNSDIVPQSIDCFLQIIKDIGTDLSSIALKQQQIAINLQSLNAPLSNIPKRYTVWKENLSALSLNIKKCRTRIRQQSAQLPFLQNDEKAITGWKLLSELEQNSYRLKKKNKDLAVLLHSPEHKKALKLCKEIIQECEKQSDPSCIDLNALITKVEEQITSKKKAVGHLNIWEAIISIHQETLGFLLYVANAAKQESGAERIKKLQQ